MPTQQKPKNWTREKKLTYILDMLRHQDDCGSGWGKPCNCGAERAKSFARELFESTK